MSVYAFDAGRDVIVVLAGGDRLARRRRRAPCRWLDIDVAAQLSGRQTALSQALWDTYVGPVSGASDENDQGVREYERRLVDRAVDLVLHPALPDESGALIVSYAPVDYEAHRLGLLLLLHDIRDAALTEAVTADMGLDVDAVV